MGGSLGFLSDRAPSRVRRAPRRTALAGLLPFLAACGALTEPPDTAGPGDDPTHGATHAYRIVTVAEGLDRPWGMAFLPDGRILVTERAGRLRLVAEGRLLPEPVAGVPAVDGRGQGGLLDVALHPQFAANRLVYLSYSRAGPRGATTAVARGVLDGDRLTGVREIFAAEAHSQGGQHFGSRLLFDRQGYLYVTIGDRGEMQRAQDRSDHAGTTVRLHDDGRVPADNPFVGESGVRPEIFTYGNRNSQGMALHPVTGEVWQTEHGPMGGDEINLVRPGRNYGWPRVSHGRNYDGSTITPDTILPGIEPPLLHWTPSIAPSGLVIYQGDAFPNWRGNLFSGALAGQHLRRVVFEGTRPVAQEALLTELRRRVRDVRQGPDGFLYLLFDEADSPLVRLEPAG